MTCRAPDCTRPARSLGLCVAHYRRLKRGKPLGPIGDRPGRQAGEPTVVVATRVPARLADAAKRAIRDAISNPPPKDLSDGR